MVASLKSKGSPVGHVINLIGHTCDPAQNAVRTGFVRKMATSSGQIEAIDSSAYWNSLIVVDDNLFPYRKLAFGNFGDGDERYKATERHVEQIQTVVAPLPEKVYLSASTARNIAYALVEELAKDTEVGSEFLIEDGDALVVRLLFTTGRAFKSRKFMNYIKSRQDKLLQYPLEKHLPHFIWIMEISRKSQFFNEELNTRCFAEVVLDATSSEFEGCPIYARVGNRLAERPSDGAQWVLAKNSPSSFAQYFHNLGH
ncbi:MAG: hypothetical protein AAF191_09090 [Verrucomicrobiota bacterium]